MKTTSEEAKEMGFKSLNQVADMIDVSTQCLRNWHKEHPFRFEVVLLGCKAKIESED